MLRDYLAWHDQYHDPNSALAERLRIVQRRLDELLTAAPPGPIRVISMCAGQGRDVFGVISKHERRSDVNALSEHFTPPCHAVGKAHGYR